MRADSDHNMDADTMRDVVQRLLELQELELILHETRIVHGDDLPPETAAMQEKVRDLRSTLPEDIVRRFDGLLSAGAAVVLETNGVCSGCRLTVPVGDLNRMRKGLIPWVCPNCGRFLLLEDG